MALPALTGRVSARFGQPLLPLSPRVPSPCPCQPRQTLLGFAAFNKNSETFGLKSLLYLEEPQRRERPLRRGGSPVSPAPERQRSPRPRARAARGGPGGRGSPGPGGRARPAGGPGRARGAAARPGSPRARGSGGRCPALAEPGSPFCPGWMAHSAGCAVAAAVCAPRLAAPPGPPSPGRALSPGPPGPRGAAARGPGKRSHGPAEAGGRAAAAAAARRRGR